MAEAFKKLDAWKNSIKLAEKIYEVSKRFPEDEIYSFTHQIRKAVISISNNIAEGSGVGTRKHQLHYYQTAIGSCNEVDNLIELGLKLNYIDNNTKGDLEEALESARKP
jgi:four helix bundle protein